jgi:hypothetical protein
MCRFVLLREPPVAGSWKSFPAPNPRQKYRFLATRDLAKEFFKQGRKKEPTKRYWSTEKRVAGLGWAMTLSVVQQTVPISF